MEIVKERLEREFDLALIATAPSVEYRVHTHRRHDRAGRQPGRPAEAAEHRLHRGAVLPGVSIITPKEYTGTLMDLCQTRRGEMKKMEYLSPERVELHYEVPLAEVVVDFFDQMKSAARRATPASTTSWRATGRRNLVKVDLLLNGTAGRRVQHDRAPRQGLSTTARGCARSSRS